MLSCSVAIAASIVIATYILSRFFIDPNGYINFVKKVIISYIEVTQS